MVQDQGEDLICIPGQRIMKLEENVITGDGTYERGGFVYSNISGLIKFQKNENITKIEVISPKTKTILPLPGDVVTCRVQVSSSSDKKKFFFSSKTGSFRSSPSVSRNAW